MDVGENTAGGDGDAAEQLVELLVVLDGKGDVAGDNAALLVVTGGVASELENLSAEVLEDGGEVDTGANTDTAGVSYRGKRERVRVSELQGEAKARSSMITYRPSSGSGPHARRGTEVPPWRRSWCSCRRGLRPCPCLPFLFQP